MPWPSPYPYFGGKARAAPLIWGLLGDPHNYVEPCFGSNAILLARPTWGGERVETINDVDNWVVNFWRAVQADPTGLATLVARQPIFETDLHAAHRLLRDLSDSLRDNLRISLDYYDLRLAALWIWGQCAWVGDNWCNAAQNQRYPVPHLSSVGQGIHALDRRDQLPAYFAALQDRLRRVRVTCGDWSRVCTEAVTVQHPGITGIVFDPPYLDGNMTYGPDDAAVAPAILAWCRDHWTDPRLRIVLCGYADTLEVPDSWPSVAWTASGGYQSHSNGNRHRERIWYSPACIPPTHHQRSLFDY